LKIVFLGTADFAVPTLRRVAQHVRLVVSQPDRPSGRGLRLQPSPVSQAAVELGLPISKPERARDPDFIQSIRELGPDLLLVVAYGQILRQDLLDAGRRGSFNLHGSILPAWRGAAPIQRCIESGASETGVTLMKMDAGMDTGAIVSIARTPIGPDETSDELAARLADCAAGLAEEWLPRLADGKFSTQTQDEALATHAAKLTKLDARLEPTLDARAQYDRFRACTSRPGAWIESLHGPIRVREARFVSGETSVPGAVEAIKPELVIGFAHGGLRLLKVQAPGKGPVSGAEFAMGARLAIGDRFVP